MSKNLEIREKNASMRFFSNTSVDADKHDNENQDSQEKPGKGRPKSINETKVRRTISVYPSTWEKAQKVVYVDRTDLSKLIGNFLDNYVKENEDKVKLYDSLKK